MVLVNVSEGLRASDVADMASSASMTDMLLYGALPALVAAFSYPIGNQLVWQVSYNSRKHTAELRKLREGNVNQNHTHQNDFDENTQQLVTEAPTLSIDVNNTASESSALKAGHTAQTQPKSMLQN